MKTFKWTVPEFPMTDREKNPPREGKGYSGLGTLSAGISFSLMSLLYFSLSGGFLKGIQTYFWSSTKGMIVSNDLEFRTHSGMGAVTYSLTIDGIAFEDTTWVYNKWQGDNRAKYDEWASQYAPGSVATVYFNRSGETSLGRWPSSLSYQWGIIGSISLLTGFGFIYRAARESKKTKRDTPVAV